MKHAKGTFEVQMVPQEQNELEGATLGRLSLEKQFSGDLAGSGKGQMLTALTTIEGSAGYVAIEQVEGTLHGRSGRFVLQHNGIMDRGAQILSIVIVPDSGTGELVGLSGSMAIAIDENGQHTYELAYTLET